MKLPTSDAFLAFWLRRGWRGFRTLFRLHRSTTGRSTIRTQNGYGSRFELQPFDYISGYVLREGYYESEVIESLKPFLKPGAIFWDIGANFGLHSITAKTLSPETHVIAFEPNPAMVLDLRHQATLNGVDIQIIPLALGAATRELPLHVVAGNPGMATLCPWSEINYDEVLKVNCDRGDLLVDRGLPAPTVIKLDVEGGETDVLFGLGRLLDSPNLEAIVFEAEAGLGSSSVESPLARILLKAGFCFSPLLRREDTQHALENYLATRRSD